MPDLDNYYKIARQHEWAAIRLTDGGDLIAAKRDQQQQHSLRSINANDRTGSVVWNDSRSNFCRLLKERHGDGNRQVNAVISELENNADKELRAFEVNHVMGKLDDTYGSQSISELRINDGLQLDQLHKEYDTNVRKIQSGDTKSNPFAKGMTIDGFTQDFKNKHGDHAKLVLVEREAREHEKQFMHKEPARAAYYALCGELSQVGRVLDNDRLDGDFSSEEMDLAIRALSGLLLSYQNDTNPPLIVQEGYPKLHKLLLKCSQNMTPLSRTARNKASMALDVYRGDARVHPAVDEKMPGATEYQRLLTNVSNLKSSTPNGKESVLRLSKKRGSNSTITSVTYKGLGGRFRRFWDKFFRINRRRNRAVLKKLENTCKDSGIFKENDFKDEVWKPALRKHGTNRNVSLSPEQVEQVVGDAIQIAIQKGLAKDESGFGHLLPCSKLGSSNISRDMLLSSIPSSWWNQERMGRLEQMLTADILAVRNEVIAQYVKDNNPLLNGETHGVTRAKIEGLQWAFVSGLGEKLAKFSPI